MKRYATTALVLCACGLRATTGTYCAEHDDHVCAVFDFERLEVRPAPGSKVTQTDRLTRVDSRTFTLSDEHRSVLRVTSGNTMEMTSGSGGVMVLKRQ